jgi:hypothetical protein
MENRRRRRKRRTETIVRSTAYVGVVFLYST